MSSSSTLPRVATKKIKNLHRSLMDDFVTKSAAGSSTDVVRSAETLSTGDSLRNFSDKMLGDDSGYFETFDTATNLETSFDDSSLVTYDEENLLPLRPLYFEVPGAGDGRIRSHVTEQLRSLLRTHRGAVISGASGSGKTSTILALVQGSSFGLQPSDCRLQRSVVGFHFLHCSDPATTDLARFIHSLAAQMSQHPALRAYRDLLLESPELQDLLSVSAVRKDPKVSLEKAVLEPLRELYRGDRLELEQGIILVDGIDQDIEDNNNNNNSIADFLSMNILRFPVWLKVVVTHSSSRPELSSLMHLPTINLNLDEEENQVQFLDHLETRIFSSERILSNIVSSNPRRKNLLTAKLVEFLQEKSHGSYLFSNLFLDLLEQGYLTVKSESFSTVPQTLEELFHLKLSLRFPCSSSYTLVSDLFSIVLSSYRPPTLQEVSRMLGTNLKDEYLKVSDLLSTRSDGSLMFVHPSLEAWLRDGSHRFVPAPAVAAHNLYVRHAYYSHADLRRTNDVLEFVHHLAGSNLFVQDKDESVSETDRKFLFLRYMVDRPGLKKAKKLLEFCHSSDYEPLRLVTIAL